MQYLCCSTEIAGRLGSEALTKYSYCSVILSSFDSPPPRWLLTLVVDTNTCLAEPAGSFRRSYRRTGTAGFHPLWECLSLFSRRMGVIRQTHAPRIAELRHKTTTTARSGVSFKDQSAFRANVVCFLVLSSMNRYLVRLWAASSTGDRVRLFASLAKSKRCRRWGIRIERTHT